MANVQSNPGDKAEKKFFEILKDFDNAMLVTHGAATGFHARPMAIADIDSDGSIWFITGEDTAKVYELEKDASLLAVMQSSRKQLAVGGRGELRRDRAKVEQIWKETFRAWFKDKNDPNIVLIRLDPIEAEYWDSSGLLGVKYALNMAKAAVSGKPLPHNDPGNKETHGKLQM
jgi:general stress protein 26